MIKSEATAARNDHKGRFLINQRRAQKIVLPVQEIKRKMPEAIGVLAQTTDSSGGALRPAASTHDSSGPAPTQAPPKIMAKGMIPFALMTRSQKNAQKANISKIELPSDSRVVVNAQKRIEEERLQRTQVKEQTML